MQVAVKNNSLAQCAALVGAPDTSAMISSLIYYLPFNLVSGNLRDDLLISVTYGNGMVMIETRLPDALGYFTTIQLPSRSAKFQTLLESRAIILGLVFLVLNIMPTQTEPPFMFKEVREATSLGSLFNWEEKPDKANTRISNATMQYLAIVDALSSSKFLFSGTDIIGSPVVEYSRESGSEYDPETIHQRMLNI